MYTSTSHTNQEPVGCKLFACFVIDTTQVMTSEMILRSQASTNEMMLQLHDLAGANKVILRSHTGTDEVR